jgi:ribosomal protein S18 acetylase RimI-like enzyme
MISKACEQDIDRIMAIIAETVVEMKRVNNHQWDDTYPTRGVFLADIAKGNLYAYRDEAGKMLGFVCLDTNQPEEYGDTTWTTPENCLVIHRTAVALDCRGQGIGKQLMQHAETVAAAMQIPAIRSDTYSTNQAMNIAFQSLGYQFSGHINFLGRPLKFNCYEKKLD